MKGWLALLIGVSSIGAAFANPPKSSTRPMPRPVLAQPEAPLASAVSETEAPLASLPALARTRPQSRPQIMPEETAALTPKLSAASPPPRKGLLGLIAPRAKPTKKAKASRKGSVCGVPSIKGETLPRVTSKTKGCGIEDPVRVTSVDGVRLSTPATINCETATALNTWVQKGLRPAFPSTDVTGISVVDSYSCRPRNNVRGAKISEHGRGNAIDISGITLANGKELTVRRNFKTLRKAYKAGCGIFSTTLGPGSDGYHEDHMHFDTARHRGNGAYCR